MPIASGSETLTAFWRLVRTPELPELGPGPRPNAIPLARLSSDLDVFLSANAVEADTAIRLTATALLYNDHHDQAHDLIAELGDPESALIHAILHRREPDFWNANYWFRRVADHSVYRAMTRELPKLSTDENSRKWARALMLPGLFDPAAFVEMCESVARRPDSDPQIVWMRQVQHAEFIAIAGHLLGHTDT